MPVVAVRIPQLGEGLQEARLIEFLKQPGDAVKRDEPIYVMETDKAVTEVESPYAGTLVEWTAKPDSVLAIGAEIGRMEVAEGVPEIATGHVPSSGMVPDVVPPHVAAAAASASPDSATHAVPMPPRTRRYLKEKGLLDMAAQIPAAGTKLMPADVDRFLAQRDVASDGHPSAVCDETPLPPLQQTLNFRLARGAQASVPATIAIDLDWTALDDARIVAKQSNGETSFAMLLWCITQAMRSHPLMRGQLVGEGKILRTYRHVNLGVAVALPDDQLVTAVVREADTLDRATFFARLREQIKQAHDGKDQIDASTTVSVSNIGSAGMRWGIPVVVTPALATLALGQVREQPCRCEGTDDLQWRRVATLTMTFDHRILNGLGAASFLEEVKHRVEAYAGELTTIGSRLQSGPE